MSEPKLPEQPSSMIAIADPEKWAGIRAVDLGDLTEYGCFGHVLAIVSGSMLSKESTWVQGKYERVLEQRTVAIMAWTIDERIVQLEERVTRAQEGHTYAKEERDAAVKRATDAEAKHAAVARELTAARESNKCDKERADQAIGNLRKLESDLAKVREVIGSKAYDDAVGKKT